jgi:hypothetical protein
MPPATMSVKFILEGFLDGVQMHASLFNFAGLLQLVTLVL